MPSSMTASQKSEKGSLPQKRIAIRSRSLTQTWSGHHFVSRSAVCAPCWACCSGVLRLRGPGRRDRSLAQGRLLGWGAVLGWVGLRLPHRGLVGRAFPPQAQRSGRGGEGEISGAGSYREQGGCPCGDESVGSRAALTGLDGQASDTGRALPVDVCEWPAEGPAQALSGPASTCRPCPRCGWRG